MRQRIADRALSGLVVLLAETGLAVSAVVLSLIVAMVVSAVL